VVLPCEDTKTGINNTTVLLFCNKEISEALYIIKKHKKLVHIIKKYYFCRVMMIDEGPASPSFL
jgi:hypothetical protein